MKFYNFYLRNVFPFIEITRLLSIISQVIAIFSGFNPYVWRAFAIVIFIHLFSLAFFNLFSKYLKEEDRIAIEVNFVIDILQTIFFILQKP